MKDLLCVALICFSNALFGQHSVSFTVRSAETGEALAGASAQIVHNSKAGSTDTNGVITFSDLVPGKYKIGFSFVGYDHFETTINIPFEGKQPLEILLSVKEHHEEEEVIIQSTRSTRTIQNNPTRVEFIAGEELDEKSNMKPGDIRMVLTESTGIQTQQTSATSANASIRIQGLDGRYTQILKDGFPLYAGFSGGLGLLQTPPLDLRQLEVIKGSASTLYGGGAIAGLVNLISKAPGEKMELKFHMDATTGGGLNSSGFYGQKFGRAGTTVSVSRNSNKAYDAADNGLTAIPEFERYTVNPKFFYDFNGQTSLNVGVNYTTEDRTGGDVDFIKGRKALGFFETNNSDRVSTQFSFEHHFGTCSHITIKNSFNHFRRRMSLPAYVFNGTQSGSFTEATYASHGESLEWITGFNFYTDNFREIKTTATPLRDYNQQTLGLFVQNTFKVNEKFSLESGLRGDHVKEHGFVLLPRVSALVKFNSRFSSRIGGGMGYKTPSIFTEESERLQYRQVLPIDEHATKPERSYGVNGDINYKTSFADGEVSFSVNQLFFYTRIKDPLLLVNDGTNYRFITSGGHIESSGMETNVKLGYTDFKLFLGYTYTKAWSHTGGNRMENLLTPRHRVNSVLLYEVEDKWKAGLEAYYFSRQRLSDGTTGKAYWINGFMVEKLWEKFSVYINFENFLDTRQTRFGTIYTGTIDNPVFKDIYAPLDGFVVNGGVKLRF